MLKVSGTVSEENILYWLKVFLHLKMKKIYQDLDLSCQEGMSPVTWQAEPRLWPQQPPHRPPGHRLWPLGEEVHERISNNDMCPWLERDSKPYLKVIHKSSHQYL